VKNINFHIAYLLTKHECVVIPGFGALVVSSVSASQKGTEGAFSPPVQSVGFNPELNHNDGLLTDFLSRIENVPYKEADILVKQYVNQLNEQLQTIKELSIQWIGDFSVSSDNRIIFTPDSHLSCNAANYGFYDFHLPLLKELHSKEVLVKKKEAVITISLSRRILLRTGSVAVAVLALFLSSTPLNNDSRQYRQNASFFPVYHPTGINKIVEEKSLPTDTLLLAGKPDIAVMEEFIEPFSTSVRTYYIVIASFPKKELAEEKLSGFKQNGFPDVAIISKENKHRIYIRRFEERKEAESYLVTFRRDYPQYFDAWLLIQKD
jgi:nucleoid DNA-binding protein